MTQMKDLKSGNIVRLKNSSRTAQLLFLIRVENQDLWAARPFPKTPGDSIQHLWLLSSQDVSLYEIPDISITSDEILALRKLIDWVMSLDPAIAPWPTPISDTEYRQLTQIWDRLKGDQR